MQKQLEGTQKRLMSAQSKIVGTMATHAITAFLPHCALASSNV